MAGTRTGITIAASGVAVVVVARLARRRRRRTGEHDAGWKSVTVLGDAERLRPDGQWVAPLAPIAEHLQVELRPAPGGRGTEVHARIRDGRARAVHSATGLPAAQALRAALRDTKQVVEAGEVLRMDPRPHGKRKATPTGLLVDVAEHRARGVGVL